MRQILWRDLVQIGSSIQGPWFISGDFNNVLSSKDRLRSPITLSETQEFRDCIDALQLTPLKSTGWHFTFCNKQQDNSRVYSKIDWVFGNLQWLQSYGHVEAEFLNPGVSDHSPILIQFRPQVNIHPKPFKLFSTVMNHPDFATILSNVWAQDHDVDQLLVEQEKSLLAEISKWSNVEEQALRQKSRANWITCGDANTGYFHAQCKIRASRNAITSICDANGNKLIDPVKIKVNSSHSSQT
ncbi:uncharacterized protein LOC132057978 [Lycium ferocissimum]|uniref:uncharacterized protein LOC132057978 n=1 Tax=Lycium ferocissimum TaxID=112874 RepID=UPI00281685AA|nr:uncharacterized protein LOC132057978 [Lycium ferocissimum]